ncbi:hypothetical protein AX16_010274, partial [Volvariella volvacea WC 439]
ESLPAELLEQVFQTCLYPTPDSDIVRTHAKLCSLAHVCRGWRTVLHSKSTFWSEISVRSPTLAHVRLVEFWLLRSGSTSPLSLTLVSTSGDGHGDIVDQLMNLFVAQAHRWKFVYFRFSGERPNDALCGLSKGSLKILESARLTARLWPKDLVSHIWDVFGSSPALRNADVFNFMNVEMPLAFLPWDQLTCLRLPEKLSCHTALAILSSCYNLKQLSVHDIERPTSHILRPIVLPHLQDLRTKITSRIPSVLNHLEAPNLSKWRITALNSPLQAQLSSCDNFLSRSQCKLRWLNIRSLPPEDNSLFSFFKSLNLIHLEEVRIHYIQQDILEELTISGESKLPVLWPSLRRLDVALMPPVEKDGLIGSMLLSRANTQYKLEEVYVISSPMEHCFVEDIKIASRLRESAVYDGREKNGVEELPPTLSFELCDEFE